MLNNLFNMIGRSPWSFLDENYFIMAFVKTSIVTSRFSPEMEICIKNEKINAVEQLWNLYRCNQKNGEDMKTYY